MKLADYVRRQDSLALEGLLVDIPLRKEYILKEIGRGKRVLDLGCQGGQISKLIKDQNNDVHGIELNARAAEAAQSRGIKVKVFDLNEGIPFEDSFFEVVNAGEIVEHIYDTKFLFDECNRVLKPGGILLFTTPNLNSLSNRVRVLTGGYLSLMGAYPEDHFGEHIRVFNLGKIRDICAHTGFRIEGVVGIPSLAGHGIGYRLMRPVVWALPQLAELLMVKACKTEHS